MISKQAKLCMTFNYGRGLSVTGESQSRGKTAEAGNYVKINSKKLLN